MPENDIEQGDLYSCLYEICYEFDLQRPMAA